MNVRPVCFNGNLVDFSIQDVLQILSLGRKTGYLELETPDGAGAIIFRNGRVLATIEGRGGPSRKAGLASLPRSLREEVIRERITASLVRVSRCREGKFSFQPSAQPPRVIEGRDIGSETLVSGIDVVELLIEVACRQEGEERPSPSVLLVDDEAPVRCLLARLLGEAGYRVVEAGDVESAVKRGASMGEAGVRFVLVTDLNMPASAGNSFRGGFEIVKRLAMLRLRPPVVLMTDGAAPARATRGASCVMLKPGLSKLDPQEFEADLRELAGRMVHEVLPRIYEALPA
jgi:CheY-like chemotaxis protein